MTVKFLKSHFQTSISSRDSKLGQIKALAWKWSSELLLNVIFYIMLTK